jgi:hypothetical protein
MNVTDRELLQFAAKAAGYVVLASLAGHADGTTHWWKGAAWGLQIEGVDGIWNPLTDDGDAFRLAVKLNITVRRSDEYDASYAVAPYDPTLISETDADPYAATRRAIVRAAAEIGRTMK